MSSARRKKTTPPPEPRERERERGEEADEKAARDRILHAAFAAFMESGYAQASMLDIATRAKVSKRELYALVGNKQEMLVACIRDRSTRFQVPVDLPAPQDREGLLELLSAVGARLVREVTDPDVVAVFRLAIAEAVHAPEVAEALDANGRETARAVLRKIVAGACASGLIEGNPAELTAQLGRLLWGDLIVSLLLGVAERPTPRESARSARDAATAFLALHPPPVRVA
jgi:AcrR family transcriptional regulator